MHLRDRAMQLRVLYAAEKAAVVAASADDVRGRLQLGRAAAADDHVDLGGSRLDGRYRAGRRHRKLVGTLDGERRLLELRHVGVYLFDKIIELVGHHRPRRIADRHGGSAGGERRTQRLIEELRLAAGGVDGGELHIFAKPAALAHELADHLDDPFWLLIADKLHLHRRERRLHIEARMRGLRDGAPRRIHPGLRIADRHGERALLHRRRDRAHQQRIDLHICDRREADNVKVESVEDLCHLYDFFEGERPLKSARRLAQRDVRKFDSLHRQHSFYCFYN
ncbi:hypothetical protein SDC9_136079 [bioreactor metagenome]|uniref:Uncharacterized protein n=1 Tax=bioreactor metagenome TaxID=1076179 RepID=A0A645DIA8_9ZZZZ